MLPEDFNHEWLKILAYSSLAAIGGGLGYIMRTMDARQAVQIGKVLLNMAAAGFVGYLIWEACNAMGISEQWTGVLVGVSGWLGAGASIKTLEKLIFNKLGIQVESPPTLQERAEDVTKPSE